jgi:hypothetical protein
MIEVTGPLWLWDGAKGSWHFLTVPEAEAAELKLYRLAEHGSFGSIRVEAVLVMCVGGPRCSRWHAPAKFCCRSRRTYVGAPISLLAIRSRL